MDRRASATYRFGDLVALVRRSWVAQVRDRMAEAGFPGYRQSDAAVLRLLRLQAWPIGKLGEVLGISRQAARKLADGLVERGYATLAVDPSDARRTLVALTAAGTAYGQGVAEVQAALNAAMSERVTAQELAAADRVLRSVIPEGDARRRTDALVPPPAPAGPGE